MCVAIERWLILSQRTASSDFCGWRADGSVVSLAEGGTFFPKETVSSLAGLRFVGPDVQGLAAGLGTSFVVFVAAR